MELYKILGFTKDAEALSKIEALEVTVKPRNEDYAFELLESIIEASAFGAEADAIYAKVIGAATYGRIEGLPADLQLEPLIARIINAIRSMERNSSTSVNPSRLVNALNATPSVAVGDDYI